MNFLSHFYHELPTTDPYYVAGVILPDILSNYSKRIGSKVRMHPGKIIHTEDYRSSQLGKGVQQHYFVDGFFHDSDYFNELTDIIDEHIHVLKFDNIQRRQFAFSHVFLEIMMDRSLLNHDNDYAGMLYTLLHQIEVEHLSNFLSTNTRYHLPEAIALHFDRFRQQRFIYHYAETQRFTAIMDSINQGLGNPPFTIKDKRRMEVLINDIEKIVQGKSFPIFVND